jgi:hypothetical protein
MKKAFLVGPCTHVLLAIAILPGLSSSLAFAQRFEAATAFHVGPFSGGVLLADFNKDGKPDLLVIENPGASTLPTTIQVLLGNGDGTFQPPITTQGIADLGTMAVADFNGDGIPDIAMSSMNPPSGVSNIGTVTIFLGNGDGTFTPNPNTFQTGNVPTLMHAVDFNGDGIVDLLMVNDGDNTVSVFTGKGDGTFNPAATQSFPAGRIDSVLSLVVGDFDGDGKPDVVLTESAPDSFVVLKGNGDGTFQPPVVIPLTMAGAIIPGILAAVDFDGDGKLDLVFVGFAGMMLFRGNGDLSFQPPVMLSGDSIGNGLEIADMDGDGHPDIVLESGFGLKLLFNDGTGKIASTETYGASGGFAVADLNGDGHPDVVLAGFGATPSGPSTVQVILNNGDGTLRAALRVPGFGRAVVADFNNDGTPDLGLANGRSAGALINSGNFQFDVTKAFASADVGFPIDAVAADLNGDGNQDIVAIGSTSRTDPAGSMKVVLGNGDGTFTPPAVQPPPLPAPKTVHKIAAGDFNGDGKTDVVVTNMDTNSTTVGLYLGNGDGTFQTPTLTTAGSLLTAIAVGDFNGDHHLDIAVTNKGDGTNPSTVSILLGNGDGTFTLGTPITVGVAPVGLATADLNGDGKVDLLVANGGTGNSGTVSILFGNGDGTFQPAVSLSLTAPAIAVTVADFDGDGFPDIAVAEQGSLVDLFTNKGDGTFPQVPEQYPIGGNPDFLIAADLNNDGLPDLLASATMSVLVNRGGARITLTSSQNPSALGQPVTFTATVVPNVHDVPAATGTVQFSDGASVLGSVTVSAAGVATFTTSTLTGGSHTIGASYRGDANYKARIFPSVSQVVRASTSVGVTSSANPSVFGSPVTITVLVTSSAGGIPTGSVSLLDATTVIASTTLDGSAKASFTLSTLTGGTHNLTASYTGDQTFLPSVSNPALAQVVNPAASSPSLNSNANPSTFGSSVSFTVQVTGVNSVAPTGTISLMDGATNLASTNLDASGNAIFNLATLGGGTHSLTANYAGDQNYAASVSPNLAEVINLAATASSISSDFNPVSFSTSFPVTAAVTGSNAGVPTGTVTLLDGPSTLTSAALDASGKATFRLGGFQEAGFGMGAGTHNFTVNYSGDQNFAASVSPVLQEVITKATSSEALTVNPNPAVLGSTVTVFVGLTPSAGGVPGLMSFLDGSTVIGSVNADANGFFTFTLSTLGPGPHSISATYPGDANRNPSTSSTVSLNVFPTDFSISSNATAATVNAGQSVQEVITIFANPSFTSPLTLSCSGLPALAACSFSPATISPNATFQSSTLTVTTTGPSAMTWPSWPTGGRPFEILATIFPGFAALMLLAGWKRRSVRRRILVVACFASLALFSSCGGGSGTTSSKPSPPPQTPDGSSTVVVTASGPNGSGVAHQITFTLIVKN